MKATMRSLLFLILLGSIGMVVAGCGAGDGDDDDSDPADDDDDTSGPVDDNDREDDAVALVITNEDMAQAWSVYAEWKDRTGLRTDVVLIEDILSKSNEQAEALRNYLITAHQQGIQYVLMGGDADQIPYLRETTVVTVIEPYYGSAPIQVYFEDLDNDWDADSDGTFGEKGEDITLEALRSPEISVGRVPVETHDEAMGFVEKLIRYESGAGKVGQRAICPLFMGDVAASVPIVGEIDGGMMHEQLIADYIPSAFQQNMRRLYGTEFYADLVGAEVGTTSKVMNAFEDEGYTFSVTNTHGNFQYLTLLLYRNTVMEMVNEVPFVFVTTSCLSGNFADHSMGKGDNPLQQNSDSVAEELVKNPNGGAVAYIGNTLIGLGPTGGVQFNHALCRSIFKEGYTILGDAMKNARATVWSEVAYVTIGDVKIEFPMTWELFPGIEWYTQRSVLLLGDPSLRVWTAQPGKFALTGAMEFMPGYNVLSVEVSLDGSPASGVPIALNQAGGVLIRKTSDASGKAEFKVDLEAGDEVTLTAYKQNTVAAIVELTEK